MRRHLESIANTAPTASLQPRPRPLPAEELSVGAVLRRARKVRGLELADVEQALRIRERHLRAIETEHFEEVPGTAYARLFLREYAEYLGLDGDRVLDIAAPQLDPSEQPEDCDPDAKPPPMDEAPGGALVWLDRNLTRIPPPIRRWGWLGAALVLLLVLALRAGGGSTARPVPVERSARARPQTAALDVPRDSRLGAPAGAATQPASRAAATQRTRLDLVAARGDCWLLVRSGSSTGPVVFEGVLHETGSVTFEGRALWVRMGAPWNLVARVNGRAAGPLPTQPGDVMVTPVGLKIAA